MHVLRDISVILLVSEAVVFALIPLALFGALVYGIWRLRRHQNLPTWLRLAQNYLGQGLSYVELAMSWIAKPVFATHTAFAHLTGSISPVWGNQDGREDLSEGV